MGFGGGQFELASRVLRTFFMCAVKIRKRGFSLVELLVVIAVLGILMAILIPVVTSTKGQASRSNDIAKMREMAQAVLLYNSVEGSLPGRYYRAIRLPSHVSEGSRDSWFCTAMADMEFLPDTDEFWSYGIEESGHGYLLNNTVYSSPGNFFGRRSSDSSKVSQPLRLYELQSNLSSSGSDKESLPQIWMITNVDGSNYGSAATGGSTYSVSEEVETPWGGRHYAFFDGHVEFIEKGSYPSRD